MAEVYIDGKLVGYAGGKNELASRLFVAAGEIERVSANLRTVTRDQVDREKSAREMEACTPWSLEECRNIVNKTIDGDHAGLGKLRSGIKPPPIPQPWNPPVARRRRR